MAEFLISDKDLTGLNGKVIIVTGSSSGIGLAAVDLFLSLGASVVAGDINAPAETPKNFTFVKTNVSVWSDLVKLFKTAKETHGRIDHVFANAGIGPREDYLSTEVDENGDLKEPKHELLQVSLKGAINTSTLAVYYLRQQKEGGSIVITGSTTGLQRIRAVDYATAKAGIIGFGRGLIPLIQAANLPIRVNTLAPSWAVSSVLPDLKGLMASIGVEIQSAESVAKAAGYLMADTTRNGNLLFVQRGRYKEIDESILLPTFEKLNGDYPLEDDVLRRLQEVMMAGQA